MNIKVLKKAAKVLLIIQIIMLFFFAFLECILFNEWHEVAQRNSLDEGVSTLKLTLIMLAIFTLVIYNAIGIYDLTKENPRIIVVYYFSFIIEVISYIRYAHTHIEKAKKIICPVDVSEVRSLCSMLTMQFFTVLIFSVNRLVLEFVLWRLFNKLRNGQGTRLEGVVHQQQEVCVVQPAPAAGIVYQHQGVGVDQSAGMAYQQQEVLDLPPPYHTLYEHK